MLRSLLSRTVATVKPLVRTAATYQHCKPIDSARISIARIKQGEVEMFARQFYAFKDKLHTNIDYSAIKHDLDLCCEYWAVPSVTGKQTATRESYGGGSNDEARLVLQNCQRKFLRYELNPSELVLQQIRDSITELVTYASNNFKQAESMTRLVTDWREPYHEVAREDQQEQFEQWLSISQTPGKGGDFEAYLSTLFTSQTQRTALKKFREHMGTVSSKMRENLSFTSSSLKETVTALYSSDFLDEKQAESLKELITDDLIEDAVDVLNLRARSLDTWDLSYPESGAIHAAQRRKLNGKYRVYFNYDLLDVVFIHEIGGLWASELLAATASYYNAAWQMPHDRVPEEHKDLCNWFLLDLTDKGIEDDLISLHKKEFFMRQLPIVRNEVVDYDSEQKDDNSERMSPGEAKRSLTRNFIADLRVRRHLGQEVAFFKSDFKWFGPSLSHNTIFAALKFFGVSDFWQNWFRKVLDVQYQFKGGEPARRQCGIPISTVFSDFLSEIVLFPLEVAVNNATKLPLFRMADDFCFWSSPEHCAKAWEQVQAFVAVSGSDLNMDKTESSGIEVGTSRAPTFSFLQLYADGDVKIDQEQVDIHIAEMKRQLDACHSNMHWVKAHNTYIKFFAKNLYPTFNALGVEHVKATAKTLRRVYQGVLGCQLHEYLAERLGGPPGVWFWPLPMGGLGVHDPFIELGNELEFYGSKHQEDYLKLADEGDMASYEGSWARYVKGDRLRWHSLLNSKVEAMRKLSDKIGYMSYEESQKYRYHTSSAIKNAFHNLRLPSGSESYKLDKYTSGLLSLPFESNNFINKSFSSCNAYWKAILTLYGPSLFERYGTLQLAKRELVPLGLAVKLASKKISWLA